MSQQHSQVGRGRSSNSTTHPPSVARFPFLHASSRRVQEEASARLSPGPRRRRSAFRLGWSLQQAWSSERLPWGRQDFKRRAATPRTKDCDRLKRGGYSKGKPGGGSARASEQAAPGLSWAQPALVGATALSQEFLFKKGGGGKNTQELGGGGGREEGIRAAAGANRPVLPPTFQPAAEVGDSAEGRKQLAPWQERSEAAAAAGRLPAA